MTDLACIGLTTLDILVRPIDTIPADEQTILVEDISMAAAGTAGGTAVVAATLGLETALISQVGQDRNGTVLMSLLEEASVDTQHVALSQSMPTSTTVLAINQNGERPNFHMMGASIQSSFSPAAVDMAKTARFFHFAGVGFPGLAGADTVAALRGIKQSGTVITCDLIAAQPEMILLLRRLLPLVDVFMPSMAEARVVLGDVSPEEAATRFVELGAKACILKIGARGAVGHINGSLINIAPRTVKAIDTTSCGDAFCAGVVCGLSRSLPLEEAAKLGSVAASYVAEGMGTTGKLDGIEQVLDAMRSNDVS